MKRIFFLLVVFALALAACQSKPIETTNQAVGGSYTDVSAEQLNTMLKNKDFVFINVHIPFEGNIAGTDLSIAYNAMEQNLSQLPADKNAKIVLYCRSGRMSAIAAQTLVRLGYTNVWNLNGGMIAWEQAGYSLEGK